MFPLIGAFSKNEADAANNYIDLIENLRAVAADFIQKTNYQGFEPGTNEEKIREEALGVINAATNIINAPIKTHSKMIVELSSENPKDEEKLKKQALHEYKKGIGIIAATKDRLVKLQFAIKNSPQKSVRDIYENEAFPGIIERLKELVTINNQLKILLG